MWRKSGTKLQGRYPATPSGGFMLGLDEFVYLAKSNLNLTIWLVQMHSKLASLVRNNIWTCQIVKNALDFAINKRFHSSQQKSPVGVAGSVLIYVKTLRLVGLRPPSLRFRKIGLAHVCYIQYFNLCCSTCTSISRFSIGENERNSTNWISRPVFFTNARSATVF